MKFIKVQQNIFIIIFWDIGFFGQWMALLYSNIQRNEVNYKLGHYYIKNYYKCKLFINYINTF